MSSTPEKRKAPTDIPDGKENASNLLEPASDKTTTSKKAKTDETTNPSESSAVSDNLRAWSATAEESSSSKIYTLKCFFGDPAKPLSSRMKTSKVGYIKSLLEERGVSTQGNKADLLDRLRTQLPYVSMEIDSRECLQRVINSFLSYFGWDNTHLFSVSMPLRGNLTIGGQKMAERLGIDTMVAIRYGTLSGDPQDEMYTRNPSLRRHMDRKLQCADMTWRDLAHIVQHPDSVGNIRQVSGAAYDPNTRDDIETPAGGFLSLEELALESGDTLNVTYDFGDDRKFTVEVTSVVEAQSVLPEEELHGNPTRVRLVNKGNGKISPQYSWQYEQGGW